MEYALPCGGSGIELSIMGSMLESPQALTAWGPPLHLETGFLIYLCVHEFPLSVL